MKKSLFEEIQARAALNYLSDMQTDKGKGRVAAVLADIFPDEYPLCEWRELASYITHENRLFENPAEVREWLTVYLT